MQLVHLGRGKVGKPMVAVAKSQLYSQSTSAAQWVVPASPRHARICLRSLTSTLRTKTSLQCSPSTTPPLCTSSCRMLAQVVMCCDHVQNELVKWVAELPSMTPSLP